MTSYPSPMPISAKDKDKEDKEEFPIFIVIAVFVFIGILFRLVHKYHEKYPVNSLRAGHQIIWNGKIGTVIEFDAKKAQFVVFFKENRMTKRLEPEECHRDTPSNIDEYSRPENIDMYAFEEDDDRRERLESLRISHRVPYQSKSWKKKFLRSSYGQKFIHSKLGLILFPKYNEKDDFYDNNDEIPVVELTQKDINKILNPSLFRSLSKGDINRLDTYYKSKEHQGSFDNKYPQNLQNHDYKEEEEEQRKFEEENRKNIDDESEESDEEKDENYVPREYFRSVSQSRNDHHENHHHGLKDMFSSFIHSSSSSSSSHLHLPHFTNQHTSPDIDHTPHHNNDELPRKHTSSDQVTPIGVSSDQNLDVNALSSYSSTSTPPVTTAVEKQSFPPKLTHSSSSYLSSSSMQVENLDSFKRPIILNRQPKKIHQQPIVVEENYHNTLKDIIANRKKKDLNQLDATCTTSKHFNQQQKLHSDKVSSATGCSSTDKSREKPRISQSLGRSAQRRYDMLNKALPTTDGCVRGSSI